MATRAANDTDPIETQFATLLPHDAAVRADGVAQLVLTLAQELWATKDRLMVLEAALSAGGQDISRLADRMQPDAALRKQLEEERQRFVAQIVASLCSPGDRR